MKPILITIFICIHLFSIAQIKNGTYISTKESYKENFILVVNDSNITYYGWLQNNSRDTLYFRSHAKLNNLKSFTFDHFEFTLQRITKDNLMSFKPQHHISYPYFDINRHFIIIEEKENIISVLVAKDSYDSRADSFTFLKTK